MHGIKREWYQINVRCMPKVKNILSLAWLVVDQLYRGKGTGLIASVVLKRLGNTHGDRVDWV